VNHQIHAHEADFAILYSWTSRLRMFSHLSQVPKFESQ
jgi:hypothetical protein